MSYILSLVPNFNDAEDIMQDTSSMMWSRFSDFEPGTDFLAWGRTIAFYRVLEYRRHQKNKKSLTTRPELFQLLEREAKVRKNDRSRDYHTYLKDCLKKLRSNELLLVQMRYMQNTKMCDIARRVGLTLRTTYRNLARIQEQLQLCVEHSARQEDL